MICGSAGGPRAPRDVRGNSSDDSLKRRRGSCEALWAARSARCDHATPTYQKPLILILFFNTFDSWTGVSGHALAVSNCKNHWISLCFSVVLLRGMRKPLYFLGFGAPGGAPPPPHARRGAPRKQTCSTELLTFLDDFYDFHVP